WVPNRAWLAFGVLVSVTFVLGRTLSRHSSSPVAAVVETVGMGLLGCVFLTATAMLLADLVTAFGLLFKSWAPSVRGAALIVGGFLSLTAIVQGNREPAIVEYEATLPGLPAALDGTVLVALSDAHVERRADGVWLSECMTQVRELSPDIVVFVGDMFDGHDEEALEIPALRELNPPLGKWFVVGNHEMHRRGGVRTAPLDTHGFRRLANESVEAAPGLVLAGVDDLTRLRRRKDLDPVGLALGDRPRGATIMLSHTPWEAERAAGQGVGLMLSGHTHGGQIWPFGYLVRTRYPLFAGAYDVGPMTVIVSRGVGTWGPRMRLWHRGEIVKVTLRTPPS
ncbi:MAG: metallophosphoesterase, partial [Myxococcota bacterium]